MKGEGVYSSDIRDAMASFDPVTECDGFDWDDGNIDHIAEHGVTPEEAEQALVDRRRVPADSGTTGWPRT